MTKWIKKFLTKFIHHEEPLTANIDFIDRPKFSENSGFTIGNREKFEYAIMTPGPGPGKYALPSTMDTAKSHTITSRHYHEKVSDTPGPGFYDLPSTIQLQRQGPVPSVVDNRTDWMVNGTEKTPAPTDYNPVPIDGKAPIGVKLTSGRICTSIGKKNRGRNVSNGKNVIAVDKCIVKLDKVEDAEDAKRYIQSSSALKSIVAEIYDLILKEKPEDPIECIKQHFLPEVVPANPGEEEEDYSDFLF
ncbi:hypothetical protein TRFO_04173 [Tritrichomonas foetus]|uniref:Uncharacterized protein n=1 Tax=Tritrichomonas foetus TaxID=1144522 RepID=A0A1J4KHZ5_9EUKA|nr:hypothetical protein TRFO_04173 [Tritrichomonas foetus]|eukprot:OHT10666.1 hypothetical protein TRFO_04173 [Tritrichomonas foetus]